MKMTTTKTLLAALTLTIMLASCAKEAPLEDPGRQLKAERPLWWVLRYKETGASTLAYEDKWYRYMAKFEYTKPGEAAFRNAVYSQCPVSSARYTVTDKESEQVVRLEDLSQIPCEPCHRR